MSDGGALLGLGRIEFSLQSSCVPLSMKFQKVKLRDFIVPHSATTSVQLDEISNDGRRVKRKATKTQVPSPVKKSRMQSLSKEQCPDIFAAALETFGHIENPFYVDDSTQIQNDQPLLEWRRLADGYLFEFIRNESRGDRDVEICFRCKNNSKDDIPKWNGKFFERVSLRSIGVFVQLGHNARTVCPNPKVVENFTVIHINGIHCIRLQYCSCPNQFLAGEWWQQLLRHRWFPATHIEPQTAATYQVMNMFHVLTLQGKDRYRSFSRMMKEWRHLKMAKRSGRGNDAERSLSEMRSGEMGIKCPACPRPDVNLPANWKDAPPKKRYLYWIFFAIDACFRLKRRLVSSEARDPDLDVGGSYFTEDGQFREYLRAVTDQQEMSTCTGLSALDHANTKHSRGYATTGVGIGVCARHEFIQLNGAVDLQKGESVEHGSGRVFQKLSRPGTRATAVPVGSGIGNPTTPGPGF
ncbi:hypothetical protein EV361DRAFT_873331 [Lentinula raphanica]|nr:hypothetical protein EV361DRAFT_873331 [Lentinula raphanica]